MSRKLGLPDGKNKTDLGAHGHNGIKTLDRHKWRIADYPNIIGSRMPPSAQHLVTIVNTSIALHKVFIVSQFVTVNSKML